MSNTLTGGCQNHILVYVWDVPMQAPPSPKIYITQISPKLKSLQEKVHEIEAKSQT